MLKYKDSSIQEFSKDSRLENFNLATKWEKQTLTWRVTKFPSNDISDDLVIRTMERAFSVWAKYADLTFIEVGLAQSVFSTLIGRGMSRLGSHWSIPS